MHSFVSLSTEAQLLWSAMLMVHLGHQFYQFNFHSFPCWFILYQQKHSPCDFPWVPSHQWPAGTNRERRTRVITTCSKCQPNCAGSLWHITHTDSGHWWNQPEYCHQHLGTSSECKKCIYPLMSLLSTLFFSAQRNQSLLCGVRFQSYLIFILFLELLCYSYSSCNLFIYLFIYLL